MLRLHDSVTGRVAPLPQREPGKVGMYVCGPTVYDDPHVGHGRFTLVWDVIRRYLEWRGLEVRFVSNITDIDDRIISRANAEDRPTAEVTAQYEKAWYDAMDALGVRRPTADPHATDYVDRMVEAVAGLVDAGAAYETDDGVYFSVAAVDDYGLLARQSLDSLRAGARVEVDEDKRSPLDFALWKKAKPGEPTWPSPWGPGRPGWHTECVVMSLDLLGDGFDLHGGGVDLAFPHHENERAQAVALGRQFARAWVHSAHVVVAGGEKMSKSLGNFTSLTDLLSRTDGRAYRLLVLRSHYRSPVEVTPETLADASAALRRLDDLARRAAEAGLGGPPDEDTMRRFVESMDDDLGTPAVMALVFDRVGQVNSLLAAGDREAAAPLWAAVTEITGVLGLSLHTADAEVPPDVAEKAAARDAARAARDWATADRLRDELAAAGWSVEDTPAGSRVRPAG